MAITVASPTAGTLQIAGAVVAGTIVGGVFVPIAQGGVTSVNGATGAVVFTYVASVNGLTGAITLMAPGGSYAADADAGSTGVSIPSQSDLETQRTALNVLVSGAGDSLLVIGQKLKALLATLQANQRPEAPI